MRPAARLLSLATLTTLFIHAQEGIATVFRQRKRKPRTGRGLQPPLLLGTLHPDW